MKIPCIAIAAVLAASAARVFAGAPLDDARAALRDGMWRFAADRAREALREGISPDEARYVLIEALSCANAPDEALEVFAGAPETFNAALRSRLARAALLEKTGRPAEALETLSASAARDDGEPAVLRARAHRLGARLAAQLGRTGEAARLYEEAIAVSPESEGDEYCAARLECARFLAGKAGKTARALEILSDELAKGVPPTPVGDRTRLLHAELSLKSGSAKAARDGFEALVAKGAKTDETVFVAACGSLAGMCRAAGDGEREIELLRAARERASVRGNVLSAGLALGLALARGSSPAARREGVEIVNSCAREFPGAPECRAAIMETAGLLSAAGDWEAAAAEYRLHMEAYSEGGFDTVAAAGLAWALHGAGRDDEALGLFARAFAAVTNPAHRALFAFKQGDILVSSGRFADAAAKYGEAIGIDPGGALSQEAAFRRADALERAGRTDEALAEWKKMDSAGGRYADEAALRAGAAEAAAQRPDAAAEMYARVLARRPAADPVAAVAHIARGKALYRAFRFENALADFEEAQSDPSHREEARYLSAMCMLNLGRDARALAVAEDALSHCAKDSAWRAKFILWIGKFRCNTREYAAAREKFLEYASVAPSSAEAPGALLWAARCSAALDDYPESVEQAGRVVAYYPDSPAAPEARIVQAGSLMQLNRFDEAVLVLRGVESPPAPQDAAVRASLLRADCLFAMGGGSETRYAEALEEYRALAKSAHLAPQERIAVAFKTARTLERLGRADEAADEYYSGVMLPFRELCEKESWPGEDARAFFVRAAFALADYHERKGAPARAAAVLRFAAATLPSGRPEMEKRMKRLEAKGAVP